MEEIDDECKELLLISDYEIKTENDLINEVVKIQNNCTKHFILSYYLIGKKILQFYRKRHGSGELKRISSALGCSVRQLQLIIKFSSTYSENDLNKLFNGKFPITWTDITSNLCISSEKFIDLYENSSSKHQLKKCIQEIKEERFSHDARFSTFYDTESIPTDLKIIEGLIPMNHSLNGHYIYFLVKEKEVVYVGQSSFLISRISDHLKNTEMIFDSYYFKEVYPRDVSRINDIEKFYIKTIKPKYNIQHKIKETTNDKTKTSSQDSN